jgi:hypothetical protein
MPEHTLDRLPHVDTHLLGEQLGDMLSRACMSFRRFGVRVRVRVGVGVTCTCACTCTCTCACRVRVTPLCRGRGLGYGLLQQSHLRRARSERRRYPTRVSAQVLSQVCARPEPHQRPSGRDSKCPPSYPETCMGNTPRKAVQGDSSSRPLACSPAVDCTSSGLGVRWLDDQKEEEGGGA